MSYSSNNSSTSSSVVHGFQLKSYHFRVSIQESTVLSSFMVRQLLDLYRIERDHNSVTICILPNKSIFKTSRECIFFQEVQCVSKPLWSSTIPVDKEGERVATFSYHGYIFIRVKGIPNRSQNTRFSVLSMLLLDLFFFLSNGEHDTGLDSVEPCSPKGTKQIRSIEIVLLGSLVSFLKMILKLSDLLSHLDPSL